jgi:hypothetical protein
MYLFSASSQDKPQLLKMPKESTRLEEFQKHVGGRIESLPRKSACKFIAYANEEGMLQNLPSNLLSWGVLRHLGFHSPSSIPFHFGNVILMGKDNKALTKAQQKQVEKAVEAYQKELEEEEDQEEEEEEEDDDDEDYREEDSMQE